MGDGSLRGRRVLVPGGTGGVGEGVVRAFLRAGAEVVVATRSDARGDELRALLSGEAVERLHLEVGDVSSFDGAARLVEQVVARYGGIDDVVAPIGGLWRGRPLVEIDETDFATAFTGLARAHTAVARAALPHLPAHGAYTVIVGRSAEIPVPSLGLVSMEQAAVLMLARVLAAESGPTRRVFSLVLGRVRTREDAGAPDSVTADEVGAVAVALAVGARPGATVPLVDGAAARAALAQDQ